MRIHHRLRYISVVGALMCAWVIVPVCEAAAQKAALPTGDWDVNKDGLIDSEEKHEYRVMKKANEGIHMRRRWDYAENSSRLQRMTSDTENDAEPEDIQVKMDRWNIKGPLRWKAWWEHNADRDGDGIVGRKEKRLWGQEDTRYDRNADGILDHKELRRMNNKRKADK